MELPLGKRIGILYLNRNYLVIPVKGEGQRMSSFAEASEIVRGNSSLEAAAVFAQAGGNNKDALIRILLTPEDLTAAHENRTPVWYIAPIENPEPESIKINNDRGTYFVIA